MAIITHSCPFVLSVLEVTEFSISVSSYFCLFYELVMAVVSMIFSFLILFPGLSYFHLTVLMLFYVLSSVKMNNFIIRYTMVVLIKVSLKCGNFRMIIRIILEFE